MTTRTRYTVVGARRSGLGAAHLLHAIDADAFVTDGSAIADATKGELTGLGFTFEENGHTDRSLECDVMVLSPGVPSTSRVVQTALERRIPVISEIELAWRHCNAPVVAITGSNGKTTTTALTGHLMRSSFRETFVAGNIGKSFAEVALDAGPGDVVVLEVSSFQLDHIVDFRPAVAVILNITPDHLDRYGGDFEAYARSKCRIFENQQTPDTLISNADDGVLPRLTAEARDKLEHAEISLDREVATGGFLRGNEIIIRHNDQEMRMPTEELPLRGRHNLYNTLAAAVAARVMEVRSDVIRQSMASFEGVPHRLEFVREIDGVRYYNDSKATNVNAVWYALESFSEAIVLIAGGRDKGNDYAPLRSLVKRKVRVLIAIGESAEKVVDELGGEARQTIRVDSMQDAVQTARMLAQEGEVVLLSPACASFDMFENYEDRGDTFRRIVGSL